MMYNIEYIDNIEYIYNRICIYIIWNILCRTYYIEYVK